MFVSPKFGVSDARRFRWSFSPVGLVIVDYRGSVAHEVEIEGGSEVWSMTC